MSVPSPLTNYQDWQDAMSTYLHQGGYDWSWLDNSFPLPYLYLQNIGQGALIDSTTWGQGYKTRWEAIHQPSTANPATFPIVDQNFQITDYQTGQFKYYANKVTFNGVVYDWYGYSQGYKNTATGQTLLSAYHGSNSVDITAPNNQASLQGALTNLQGIQGQTTQLMQQALQPAINNIQINVDSGLASLEGVLANSLGHITSLNQNLSDSTLQQLTGALSNISTTQQQQQAALTAVIANLNGQNAALNQNIKDSTIQGLTGALDAINNNQQNNNSQVISLINGLNSDISKAISDITGLPTGIIGEIIQAIKLLVDNEVAAIAADLKKTFSRNGIPILDIISGGVSSFNDALQSQGNTIDKLLSGKFDNLQQFYDEINRQGANSQLFVDLQNAFTLFFGIVGFLKARLQPAEIVLNQLVLAQDTPNINDINTLVEAYFKNGITFDVLSTNLYKHGLDDTRIAELISARRMVLGFQDIKTAYQRGIIDDNLNDYLLKQYGLDDSQVKLMRDVYPLLPSPTDITRLADKHIFSGDIAAQFGQYSEIDQGYIDAMQLWGIDPDWTRKLWAAHWSLPGLQDVFDMHHRGIINDADRDTYFKLTDILPFFRDRLVQLNYTLISRVDIRRFYGVGVFNQQDVYDAYIKLGYSPQDAAKQTQFTVEHERLSEEPHKVKIRALTEAMVVKAFKEGIISENEAVTRLGTVGFLAPDARLILQLETQIAQTGKQADKTQTYHDKALALILQDYSKGVISRDDANNYLIQLGIPSNQASLELFYSDIERVTILKSKIIEHVKIAYSKGQIDKPTATNLMLSNGFGMSEINLLFEELDLTVGLRNKELTLAQVEKFYKDGIITLQEFIQELANIGYNDKHITWIVASTEGIVQ